MKAEERVIQLETENAELRQQLAEALARIDELERQQKKDSHNSHKPPSSDGLRRKTHSLRKSSGRKSGGQSGHAGQTLELVGEPDGRSSHRPQNCQQCGKSLERMRGRVVERRQVHDLPEIRLVVQEHQVEEISCPHCQQITRGSFPREVSASAQYGPRVRAWGVYLNQYELVPMERTCQIRRQGLSCAISEGTLANWVQLASQRLRETCEKIKQSVISSCLMHGDETGLHLGKKLHWLHVNSTRFLTHLQWHQRRGYQAMDDIGILPNYQGRIMRDRLSSYDHYTCEQSICGAHLLRDLISVFEQCKQQWASEMKWVLIAMKKVAWYWQNLGAKSVP